MEIRVIKDAQRIAKIQHATSKQEIAWSVFQNDLERIARVLVTATRAIVQTMGGL